MVGNKVEVQKDRALLKHHEIYNAVQWVATRERERNINTSVVTVSRSQRICYYYPTTIWALP